MELHLKRFLWYYRTVTGKDYPTPGEELIISHDSIALAGLDYWKFIYTMRKLVDAGYLEKGFRRRYIITQKLVEAVRRFFPSEELKLTDKINNTFIELLILILKDPQLKSQLMMTLGASSEKELAELIKKLYELMQSLNEKMNILLKRLEDLRQEVKKYEDKVSGVSEDTELGRVIVDNK